MSSNERIVVSGCGWVTPVAAGSMGNALRALWDRPFPATPTTDYLHIPDVHLGNCTSLGTEIRRDRDVWIPAIAIEWAMRQAFPLGVSLESERIGLVLGSAWAGQLGMIQFAEDVRAQGPRFVSPIHFPQTVGNFPAGALARAFNFKGPNLTIAAGDATGLDAIIEACRMLVSGEADLFVAGAFLSLSSHLVRFLKKDGVPLWEGACLFALELESTAIAQARPMLATIEEFRQGYQTSDSAATGNGVSVAIIQPPQTEQISLHPWLGHSPGVSSASALAAAIGAGWGEKFPALENLRKPTLRPIVSNAQNKFQAVVFAKAENGRQSAITVSVDPRTGLGGEPN